MTQETKLKVCLGKDSSFYRDWIENGPTDVTIQTTLGDFKVSHFQLISVVNGNPSRTNLEFLRKWKNNLWEKNPDTRLVRIQLQTTANQTETNFVFCTDFLENLMKLDLDEVFMWMKGSVDIGLRANDFIPLVTYPFDVTFPVEELLRVNNGMRNMVRSFLKVESSLLKPMGMGMGKRLRIKFDLGIGWEAGPRLPKAVPRTIKLNGAQGLPQLLLDNEELKDYIVVAGNGAELKCHSLILAANSHLLARMVSPSNDFKESATKRIEMKYLSESGLNLFLKLLYGVELPTTSLDFNTAVELFQTAHMFELNWLLEQLVKLFGTIDENWYTGNGALELHYFLKNANLEKAVVGGLSDHILRIIKEMPAKIRECERFQELNPEEKLELYSTLLELEAKQNEPSPKKSKSS